jgi:hypothetical protein
MAPINTRKYFFLLPIVLLTVHAFFMNGYYYVHRELTVGTYLDPIVAKADPSLFKNSIFVQGVNRTHARLSLSYDIFSFILKHADFETFAMILVIISLFFILAGIFVLTKVLFGSSAAGYAAALLYSTELNAWTLGSPSPYLNFFHYGLNFSYPLIIWSLVFFFQKRYPPALLLAGISWNFHPMCTVFLLFAYFTYWMFHWKEFRFKTLLNCFFTFIIPALPVLLRTSNYLSNTSQLDYSIFMTCALWTAWFTCFPSTWPLPWLVRSGLFFSFFMITLYYAVERNLRNKILTFTLAVAIMCFLGTIFADYYPLLQIIKLSLWRSTFLYIILALPCIGYFLTKIYVPSVPRLLFVIAIVMLVTGYYSSYTYPILFGRVEDMRLFLSFCVTAVFFLVHKILNRLSHLEYITYSPLILVVVCIILLDIGVLYNKGGPAIYYHGRVLNETDPWADIQMFAQKHSKKDDLFIIPPYMNDFGIYSQRATLGDWAEGSNAFYLDNQFACEWLSRMSDLGWRKLHLHGEEEGYQNLTTGEILMAAKRYGAKYIITQKPKTFELKKIYDNKLFILYKVAENY